MATRTFRRRGFDRLTTTTIQLRVADLPAVSRLSFRELGLILNEITEENRRGITVEAANDGSPRVSVRNSYYPVKVSRRIVTHEVASVARPTTTLHDGQWCLVMPGQQDLIPVGRRGSLKGELLDILVARWGQLQSIEHVREMLAERVTDQRTQNQSIKQLEYALREINGSLHPGVRRRLRRLGTLPNDIGIIWRKYIVYSAVMVTHKGRTRVGLITE